MKKLIQWLAKVFNAEITKEVVVEKEKIVYKDRIVEVPVEVIKEVIKEVEVIKEMVVEVPVYKETKYVALKDEVTNDTFVEGNLIVKGYLYVNGEVTCYKIKGE